MKRNHGIDLLRMVSMLMVAVLHVLGQGGVLAASGALSWRHGLCWLLEAAAFCAVDCYALISGYVGTGRKFRISGIALLWLRVVFWTLIITTVTLVIAPELVGIRQYVRAVLPVTMKQYWYFTSYFCVFFLMPFLDSAVENLPRRLMTFLLAALAVIFTILPLAARTDLFGAASGYTPVWLAVLYLFGAYARKYELLEKLRGVKALALFVLFTLATLAVKLAGEALGISRFDPGFLYSYTSPTVLAAAICLLGFFASLRIGDGAGRAISFLAPTAFSVYLIHTHPLVWMYLLENRFVSLAELPAPLCALAVLGCALTIFAVCSALDLLRELLFRALKLKERLTVLDGKITK